MSELEKLAERIEKLSPEELKKFRAWFTEFDARVWDAQIDQTRRQESSTPWLPKH